MTALQYILDGLEAELRLARERGVRSLEVDRALLATPARHAPRPPRETPRPARAAPRPPRETPRATPCYDFVFLHAGPLLPVGAEMIGKITTALGRTAETAPVITALPLPAAQFYVVLGSKALRQFFPNVVGAPGQWPVGPNGERLLISYSPHYFLRFPKVTAAVDRMKHNMWRDLKVVLQKLN